MSHNGVSPIYLAYAQLRAAEERLAKAYLDATPEMRRRYHKARKVPGVPKGVLMHGRQL